MKTLSPECKGSQNMGTRKILSLHAYTFLGFDKALANETRELWVVMDGSVKNIDSVQTFFVFVF